MADFEKVKSNIHLKDIKSFYIIKNLFSFLSKKQKLSIIAYNKELQKMFGGFGGSKTGQKKAMVKAMNMMRRFK